MKLLVILLIFYSAASPLCAQRLSEIQRAHRVKVFTNDGVIVGNWVGVEDSIAGVSEKGKLLQLQIDKIDQVQVFRSSAREVGVVSGIVVGGFVGITFGMYLAGTCETDCTGGALLGGSAAFILAGAAAGLAGTMIGSALGVGRWQDHYNRSR